MSPLPVVQLPAGPVEPFDTGGDGPVLGVTHGLLMDASAWSVVIDRLRRPPVPGAHVPGRCPPASDAPGSPGALLGGRLVLVPGAGTLLPLDAPAELADAVRACLPRAGA